MAILFDYRHENFTFFVFNNFRSTICHGLAIIKIGFAINMNAGNVI